MLKNGESLNFLVTPATISGIASNSADSVFKRWSVMTSDICSFDESFEPIKVSIYKGGAFEGNVLEYFGDLANIEIQHMNGNAVKMTISNGTLTITVVNAPAETTYVEYAKSTIDSIFTPPALAGTFSISSDQIKRISSLSKLSTNPETQTVFVSLYTKDGMLYATDKAFDLKLHEQAESLDEVKINKSFLGLLCSEDYVMTVHNTDDGKILVANSQQSNTTAAMILVETIEDVDFNFDKSEYNWDN